MVYDPNYNYEADDGDNNIAMDTEDEEYGESEEYSDDDDMSWKVRRAAAKCLEAVISTRHEMIDEFFRTLSPALIMRFKEREENVKSDIFHAYIALLNTMRHTSDDSIPNDPDSMDQVSGTMSLLQNQVPAIVKAVEPLMTEKSIRTRQDCFALLKELLIILPGALGAHIPQLMSGIVCSLSDKNATSNMKIDALGFVCSLLQSHNPEVFHPHIQTLVDLIVKAVFDPFYKIATEALVVLQQLVKVIRPLEAERIQHNFDIALLDQIYSATLQKLKSTDVDQEVKERAIACMGQIISNMGKNQNIFICFFIYFN